MQKTAAIYTRISQDRTGAGLGIDRQEKDCRELAKSLGYEVGEVYSDNDVSAYSGKVRPGYERMLEDIADGRFGAVLAWHTDRLHRRTTELERYIEKAGHIPTHTVKGGVLDLSTPAGRMTAKVAGAVAQHEVEHMIERATRKHQELQEAGLPSGGGRPFGYEKGGMVVCEWEAELIRDATDRLLGKNGTTPASLASLMREWNEAGIKTSRGGTWNYSSFTSLVRRWRNAGIREHKGEPVGPAAWPAIVDEADLRKLRALLSSEDRRTNKNGVGRKHVLSGIITCGKCGNRMRWGKTTTRAGIPYELYQCTGGLDGCRSSVLKDIAEEEVTKWVATRLAFPSPDLMAATADDRAKLDALNTKRAELAEDVKAMEAAGLSRASRIKFTAEIDAERKKLEAETDRLLRRVALADMFSDLTLSKMGKEEAVGGFSIRLAAEDIAHRFTAAPLEKRQAVVRALVKVQVLPHPKGVRATKELARQRIDITPLNVMTGEPLHTT